jgi:ribosome-associated heat shock protein Hsp15
MTSPTSSPAPERARARLDRWLWAARFFKTRALAKAAIEGGKVLLLTREQQSGADDERQGQNPKPGKEIGAGDRLLIRRGPMTQTIRVLAVDERRGSATAASALFEESLASIEAREIDRAQRQLERAGLQLPALRPDKRDRRERMKLKHAPDGAAGNRYPSDDHQEPA